MASAGSIMRSSDASGAFRLEDDLTMTQLTRAALARLRRHPEEDVRNLVERVEARLGS